MKSDPIKPYETLTDIIKRKYTLYFQREKNKENNRSSKVKNRKKQYKNILLKTLNENEKMILEGTGSKIEFKERHKKEVTKKLLKSRQAS